MLMDSIPPMLIQLASAKSPAKAEDSQRDKQAACNAEDARRFK
jgi:hypothetical protein